MESIYEIGNFVVKPSSKWASDTVGYTYYNVFHKNGQSMDSVQYKYQAVQTAHRLHREEKKLNK